MLLLAAVLPLSAREFAMKDRKAALPFSISLPDGFDVERDHCPMVILMHGIFAWKEFIPMRCSEEFLATYGDAAAELIVIEGENHTITRKRKEVVAATVGFFSEVFGR